MIQWVNGSLTQSLRQKEGIMNQLHTAHEQRFIDLAATLADELPQRAARYDEEEAFPYENYARLRESACTIMTIPGKLGGVGACMLQRIKAHGRSAPGCGAAAVRM